MHITSTRSLTPNALEGCYYLFPDAAATWEAGYSLLATGTEDYFESAFYFDAGVYAQPYTGVTVREGAEGAPSRISAYKIHGSHDPMVFSDGFTLKWRNGGSVTFLLSPRIELLAVLFFGYSCSAIPFSSLTHPLGRSFCVFVFAHPLFAWSFFVLLLPSVPLRPARFAGIQVPVPDERDARLHQGRRSAADEYHVIRVGLHVVKQPPRRVVSPCTYLHCQRPTTFQHAPSAYVFCAQPRSHCFLFLYNTHTLKNSVCLSRFSRRNCLMNTQLCPPDLAQQKSPRSIHGEATRKTLTMMHASAHATWSICAGKPNESKGGKRKATETERERAQRAKNPPPQYLFVFYLATMPTSTVSTICTGHSSRLSGNGTPNAFDTCE